LAAGAAKGGGKLVKDADITLGEYGGREVEIEFSAGAFIDRLYIVGRRLFQVTVLVDKDHLAARPSIMHALDSFKVLTPLEVEAEMRKKVEEATPAPLPQTPSAPRAGSDAADAGLRGKVKSVFTETEDLSGTWSVQGHKPKREEEYDETGNLTKDVTYDYRGNPMEIYAYGYIDGERVSNSKMIRYEYDPPPVMIASTGGKPPTKRDPRYGTKYKYRYAGGHLVEEWLYRSDGELFQHITYSYKGNQKEETFYDSKGTVNRRYLYTLDAKGNELEEVAYEGSGDKVRDRYAYAYEFDAQGNWTKRTVSKQVTKDGQTLNAPAWVDYRRISYY